MRRAATGSHWRYNMSAPRVEKGAITVLRLFDVAYAIDLPRVEALAAATTRMGLQRAGPKAISFDVPPVRIFLGRTDFPDVGAADLVAHVYDFGVVSILLSFSITDRDWVDFSNFTQRVVSAAESATGTDFWQEQLDRVRALIAPAMERPSRSSHLQEDYLIAAVHRLEPTMSTAEFLERVDVVPLLSGETRPLAPGARAELVRQSHSYYADDLVLLTWDRALVLEPGAPDTDIADVIEVANAQLLELRYYDELLDDELPLMYDRVAEARQALRGLGRGRYATLARQLHRLVAEVTEITERVDNALKITEDVYLARVYVAALDLFRVRNWGDAVDRKLAIVRDTYATLYDEAATARAELLELTIVLLIVLEILLAWVF
jgi:hypothetical protein